MRIKIYLTLGILTFYKDICIVNAKSFGKDISLQREFENYMNCTKIMASSECLEITGRRRKGGNNGNNVVIIGGQDHDSYSSDDESYYIIEEDHGGKKGKRRGKKKNKRKKGKGSKIYKKMRPIMYGMGGLKLLLDHFLLKKLAFVSFFTFILSKISFVLASLVALKQFFHNPAPHGTRAESHKVEVIHIPIKKFKSKHGDVDYDESKLIPVTFPPNLFNIVETTPTYYSYPSHSEFISSEETDDSNKVMNEDEFLTQNNNEYDRSDHNTFNHNEKSFYLNHVESPFV